MPASKPSTGKVKSITLGELSSRKSSVEYNKLLAVFAMPSGEDRYKNSFDNALHRSNWKRAFFFWSDRFYYSAPGNRHIDMIINYQSD